MTNDLFETDTGATESIAAMADWIMDSVELLQSGDVGIREVRDRVEALADLCRIRNRPRCDFDSHRVDFDEENK